MTSNLGVLDAEKLKIGFGKNTKTDTDVAAVKSSLHLNLEIE